MTFAGAVPYDFFTNSRPSSYGHQPYVGNGFDDQRRWGVLDVVFMGVVIGFFVISVGYVYACDHLMK